MFLRVASGGYSTSHSFRIKHERPYLVEDNEEGPSDHRMVCATHVCENESSDHRDSACESTHGDNSTNAHSSEKEQPSPSSHNNDNGDYVTVEPELLELQVTFILFF